MKIVKTENFRVVVEPPMYTVIRSDYTEKQYRSACDEIVQQIKRHVDNVQYVSTECDSKYICEYCGYTWEEDETGEPMCCGKAQEEFKENTADVGKKK